MTPRGLPPIFGFPWERAIEIEERRPLGAKPRWVVEFALPGFLVNGADEAEAVAQAREHAQRTFNMSDYLSSIGVSRLAREGRRPPMR